MKERLIELLNDMQDKGYVQAKNEDEISCHVSNKNIAQYLLENGVIVPPCKVGDKVYLLLEKITGEYVVVESICKEIHDKGFGRAYFMHIDCPEIGNTLEFYLEDFGKTVFLTYEEAQKALEGVEG